MKNFKTKTDLMPHESDAVIKLIKIRVGALFMETGTGKSRTAIEFVHRRRFKIDRVIWFCPVSLKETVRQEILKHTNSTKDDIYIFDDKTNENNIPVSSWYIVGIESMSSSDRVVLTTNKLITEKTFVILDESSYIKGHKALRTQRITFLSKDAKYRMILTGTPISQGVEDLYSQMYFLSPKILGYSSFYSFAANHLEYSELYPGMIVRAHNTEWIAAKIQPYVYQVTKEEAGLNLPKKLFATRYFQMTEKQRYYYEMAKDEILSEIDQDDFDSTIIFRLFTTLQQIVSGYWGFYNLEFEHERIGALLNTIEDIPKDEKVVIWAKYQYDIKKIGEALVRKYGEESCSFYYGLIPEKKRSIEEEKFNNESRFFIATPSTGGHGLNSLIKARYVIYYNNVLKYSERLQSEDRNHRMGQTQSVTYIDIHCIDSIDDRIYESLIKKENTADDFKQEVDKVKGDKVKLKELIKKL